MDRARVYEKGDSLYLHSIWEADDVLFPIAPFLKVKRDCITAAKGKFAVEVLRASGRDNSQWEFREDRWKPLLELAGAKSWEGFARDAKSLCLEAQGGWLRVIPLRNRGPNEGFEYLNGRSVDLAWESSLHEIGAAVELALFRCESCPDSIPVQVNSKADPA